MSEDPALRVPTTEEVAAAAFIEPLALAAWGNIPETSNVILNASRVDMDRLFMGLRLMLFAQGDTLEALNMLTHNEVDRANLAFARAAQRQTQALGLVTAFTAAAMLKAQVDG